MTLQHEGPGGALVRTFSMTTRVYLFVTYEPIEAPEKASLS